jgi:hypothetical protein
MMVLLLLLLLVALTRQQRKQLQVAARPSLAHAWRAETCRLRLRRQLRCCAGVACSAAVTQKQSPRLLALPTQQLLRPSSNSAPALPPPHRSAPRRVVLLRVSQQRGCHCQLVALLVCLSSRVCGLSYCRKWGMRELDLQLDRM